MIIFRCDPIFGHFAFFAGHRRDASERFIGDVGICRSCSRLGLDRKGKQVVSGSDQRLSFLDPRCSLDTVLRRTRSAGLSIATQLL